MTTLAAEGATKPKAGFSTIAAITIGNGLEFFDFTSYGFFTVLIGRLFFPVADPVDQLILSLTGFAIPFLARPLGGVVLGLFADRVGRKAAMTWTLWLMALGSLGVACAPTYAQIGLAAPVWIVTSRMIQGFALGGEVGASTSLLLEYADDSNRGWYGSWQFFSQGLSSLLGAGLATLLTTTLSHDALYAWGWRVPFMIGVLMVPLGAYIRTHLDETLVVQPAQASSAMAKLKTVFKNNGHLVRDGILLIIGGTTATYIVVFYLSTYATTFLGLPASIGALAGVTASLTIVVVSPIAGVLSDRFGRKAVTGWPRIAMIIILLPSFMLLQAYPTAAMLLSVVAVLAVLLALSAVASIVMITEMMPRPVRATALSIIYSVGVAIFGSATQLIATELIKVSGNQLAPAWYLIATNLISLIPLLYLKETAGRPA
jgi:MHS family proline/betaine transporter-like MFS transporter